MQKKLFNNPIYDENESPNADGLKFVSAFAMTKEDYMIKVKPFLRRKPPEFFLNL